MNLDQPTGTPPQIWKRFEAGRKIPISTVYDQVRIKRLCRQVEHLSGMLEHAFDCYIEPEYGLTLEEAEERWTKR